jgi:bacteriorhodopsin
MLLKTLGVLLYAFVLAVMFVTMAGLGYGMVKETYKYFTVKEVKE